ncbi:hypothetical protein Tco_1564007, partial [Tanacetum coccineum]
KVFNWETAKYGKIWYDEDIHDLRSVETEFPAIAFNDGVSSEKTPSCESTVSSLNDEIEFRISFDDSDDEDYTVIFNKNLFSYKIISTNDLKKDSENDNEKVNMPSLPPSEPMVSCLDDLDFFNDFENEFPSIVYNDAQTSKLDLLTEPILNPQYINEFDLNDETSLSEYDEEEQNVLYFNDLFPFNIIHPDDLKLEKDNDDNEIDIIQSLRDMAPLPPRDQRHLWLRYQVEGYNEEIVHDFEQRLEMIFGRQDLAERMRMVYTGDDGQEVFVSHAWRRLFGIRAPLVQEFILKFFSTCRIRYEMGLDVAGTLCFQLGEDGFKAYWLGSERLILDKGDLSDYWVKISSGRDFLRGQTPEKVTATDLFYLCSMDRGVANIPYMLAQYLFKHAEGRKSGARLSRGHFIGRLAHHFGLVSDDALRGLYVVAPPGPERQQVVAAGAPGAAEDAPAVDEGVQADPAPIQAPQQQPPPPSTIGRTMPQRLRRLEEEVQGSWRLAGRHFRYSMGPSRGVYLQHSRDAPGEGLARPALPQPRYSHQRAEWRRESDSKCVEAEEKV